MGEKSVVRSLQTFVPIPFILYERASRGVCFCEHNIKRAGLEHSPWEQPHFWTQKTHAESTFYWKLFKT